MNNVNLDDLKIDHSRENGNKKGSPWVLFILFFILGWAVSFGVVWYWPDLIQEEAPKQEAGVVEKTTPVTSEIKKQESTSSAGFTEGGWIEVPSYHPVVVSALIPGRLDSLEVLEGSAVKKNQVLARIYDRDFRTEVARAAADLRAAEAEYLLRKAGFRAQEVEKARADLAAAETNLTLKRSLAERTRALLDSGAVSREELERDEAALGVARAERETLQQELLLKEEGFRTEEVEQAAAEVARKQAALTLAQNKLDYTVIRSPMDGVVLHRFVTPGTFIDPRSPGLVSIYDPNDLQVRVDVRQENLGAVHLGQEVEIFTDAEPGRSYAGEVIRIEPMADFKKNTIQVKIKVQEPSRRLHPEMIARIKFTRSRNDSDHGEG